MPTPEKRVIILGAGFAGLTLATELDPLAESGNLQITLVDRNPSFRMGFSMQWVLAGRRRPEDGERFYSKRKAGHIAFLQEEVRGIDISQKIVKTNSRNLEYDSLLLALGAELVPDLIPGLSESAFNLCELSSVLKLKDTLKKTKKGVILITISSVPFKCPPAPYEYAFLVDDLIRQRGKRGSFRIAVTTPEPQPMPVAGKIVGEAIVSMLTERGIEFFPNHKPKEVQSKKKKIVCENGVELAFDLLAAMPLHRAPQFLHDSGLVDGSGFIPVDLYTFKTRFEGIYAVGDVASLKLPNGNPHPKAGIFAEAQAHVLSRNLSAEITGGGQTPYQGDGICFVDTGRNQAAQVEAHLLIPEGPRVTLNPPSEEGLRGKGLFEEERFTRWFGG